VTTVPSAAAATDAARRAAVAEGVHKNAQQIRNVEAQISILKAENDALEFFGHITATGYYVPSALPINDTKIQHKETRNS
jgi:hypothetical protein